MAEAARQERRAGIPKNLLAAIALAESGRWHGENGENFAWPWTVTVFGKGHFFPDKYEAVDFVRDLKDSGVRNIDVGCMQINMIYHGDAFASLEHMMDPATNVAYAARHLKSLNAAAGSWEVAAGRYHSFTPARAAAYRARVLDLWDRTEAGPPERVATAPAKPLFDRTPAMPLYKPARIDRERTQRLNLSFQRAGRSQADAAAGNRPGGTQLADASRYLVPDRYRVMAEQRRGRLRLEQRQRLELPDTRSNGADFAARRRAQLDDWRRRRGDDRR